MGAFLGRDKSEEMIKSKLERHSGKRVIRGTVNIQGASTRNNGRV
jgi:hypothetical protein